MALYKLEEFDADYKDSFGSDDLTHYDVYSDMDNDKIGSIKNIMVDDSGHFRYFVVDTGFWVFGKQVLLPVGLSRIDSSDRRVYAVGLTKEQVENLPEFREDMTVDRDYEDRVTGVYDNYPLDRESTPLGTATGVMPSTPSDTDLGLTSATVEDGDPDLYNYQQKPHLFDTSAPDRQKLKLYEERLIANKQRHKTGEVSIGKRVETDTQSVTVPLEKEQVVIERNVPSDADRSVSADAGAFQPSETVRMDVYEEQPDIRKETVLREEVNVRKETVRDNVSAQEQVRREELDVNSQGNPVVERDS